MPDDEQPIAGAQPPAEPVPEHDPASPDAGGLQETMPDEVLPAPLMAHFRLMELISVAVDLPSQYPVVTLQESEPPFRQLSLPIGMADGLALSHASRRIATPRPLTHQLFAEVLGRLNVDVVAVRLIGRSGGTYLGELDLMSSRGREVVPCRPSDALSLALRFPTAVPLLADKRLLVEDGDVDPI
jgi:bifunctional DNase/RNase